MKNYYNIEVRYLLQSTATAGLYKSYKTSLIRRKFYVKLRTMPIAN